MATGKDALQPPQGPRGVPLRGGRRDAMVFEVPLGHSVR